MSGETVTLQGLQPLLANLDLTSKQIGVLAGNAMEFASGTLESTIQLNALRILRMAEAKGYKRKKGKHLYQTVGHRLKYYRDKSSIYVAVGPVYKAGGYHSHLVEFGHRVVKGGTISGKKGRQAGITAAGKRQLKAAGLHQTRNGRWVLGVAKVTIGEFYNGARVRGGGQVKNTVPGYPFQLPAWQAQKGKVLFNFENSLKQSLKALVQGMKT